MSDERFNELVNEIDNLSASQRALLKAQVLMNVELQEQQLRTAKSFDEMQKAIKELAASVKVIDANVAALVTMHREQMEGKNGKQ